ncbi:ChrR family anti-sigma-E factor [Paracidovorax wautersii]|uniref:Anti-ECFsigma factor, ChrR n=1 Tax=Paracidovorax wautersii TaxID=1177982 RepID=A0A1I2GIM3_9BURK|nr:ChrR family anti-sigma-E factor [Paracidovorax wautersii]SFF17342.1 anti-ECFsigma factor, ChrR [Paracidovorax wautersii]
MKIRHHPEDALLLAHAAGQLPTGPALVVASHLESCPRCRERVREYEALGGALLEAASPAALAPDALARALAAIDATPGTSAPLPQAASAAPRRPALPPGTPWPAALEGCSATGWRWMGPGMYWSRVTVPQDPAAKLFLLRIGAGKRLPTHTHSDLEMTQVLYGRFDDGRASFGAGDFDSAAGDIHHQPVVAEDGMCICLASVDGRLLFDGVIARTIGGLVGM